MKRFFATVMILLTIVSLVGCTSSDREPETLDKNTGVVVSHNHEKVNDTSPIDPSTPKIPKKYDNPEDDPRMIVQKNLDKVANTYAFIDSYNLIGYSYHNGDHGEGGCDYFFDENEEYLPAATSNYRKFVTPPTEEDSEKANKRGYTHLGYIDLEGWARSLGYEINISTYGSSLWIDTGNSDDGHIIINEGSITYLTANARVGWTFWDISPYRLFTKNSNHDFLVIHSEKMMWALERALIYMGDADYTNPW